MAKVVTHRFGVRGTEHVVDLCRAHESSISERPLPAWIPSVDYHGVRMGAHHGHCAACEMSASREET